MRAASWLRATGPLPDDPLIHQAILAYASDWGILSATLLPHGRSVFDGTVQAASLDHAIWFHETPDFNQWHLFATDSPWAGHARGLNHGHFFDETGRMVATVSQESLMRPKGDVLDRLREGETP